MDKRLKELEALLKISQKLTSTLNLGRLLSLIMESSAQVMGAEASSLMLLEEESGELIFRTTWGGKKKIKELRLKVGEGIAGWVAKTGKPLLIKDVKRNPRFSSRFDRTTGFKTKSILCVPLKIKDRIIGVVEVLNKIEGSFSQEDLRVFTALASQAAVAIDNARLYTELEELFFSIIKSLSAAIDAKDPYTEGHSERVADYAVKIAEGLGLGEEEIKQVRLAGLLHDIGKMGIDDRILRKKKELTRKEYKQIKNHSTYGADILRPIKKLKDIIPGVKYHHERWDGKGYPEGLKREGIPLLGRIIGVADTFDALTSDRPYRKALDKKKALNIIKENTGTQLDKVVVGSFLQAVC